MPLEELIKISTYQKQYLDSKKTKKDNEYWRVLDTLIEKAELYDRYEQSLINDGK